MVEQKKTKILNYINVFRGLAILLIVAGHSMQFGEIGSFAQRLSVEVFAGGTALFIFISGFLFQHLSGKYEYKNYMKKKWTNVVQPYLWTAIPGILFCFLFPIRYGNAFDGLNPLLQIPMMLSVGRVHNTPAWFIPMIILFFFSSYVLLKAESKGILYKLLPLLFAITVIFPRQDVDYNSVMGLSYTAKYLAYLKYVLFGYIHFFSMYVFGMYCSAHKEIIDKFYNSRWLYIITMLVLAGVNLFSPYTNGTVSKIFLTIIVLAYLKHYDEWLIAHTRLNKVLDVIAKYSFGIFFVHWYLFFLYNLTFGLPNVMPVVHNYALTFVLVFVRFVSVSALSMLVLWAVKTILLKINPDTNTRSFIGV